MQTDVKWTLENARNDYNKSFIKKTRKKSCKDCMFWKIDGNGDNYCEVRERVIYFDKIKVRMCKYFTSRHLNRK